MAKRKTPPRYKSGPKKGQFMSKRARAARKGGRTTARKRTTTTRKRRRTTKRNPGRTVMPRARTNAPRRARRRTGGLAGFDFVGSFVAGATEATQVLVGKALARSVPDLVGLPKQGNIGLAIQTGVALLTGYAAEMFVSAGAARALMAGGLTAPLETLIVAYNVPWLAPALHPVTGQNALGSYVMGANGAALAAGRRRALGRYVTENDRGLGRYVSTGSG